MMARWGSKSISLQLKVARESPLKLNRVHGLPHLYEWHEKSKSSLENDSAIRICLEYFCEPKTELFHSILASGILEMLRSCSYFPIGQRESTIWVINLLAMCLLFFGGVMAPNPQKQRNPTILGRPGHPFI